MTYRLVIQPRAERDIQTAALWILGQSNSAATAMRWGRGLRVKIATLIKLATSPDGTKSSTTLSETANGLLSRPYGAGF